MVSQSDLSPYQLHVRKWRDCQRCSLAPQRKRVVFARGEVPADLLFVGEAPGNSENATGLPFDGPAGSLMDRIIREALDLDLGRQRGFFRYPDDVRPVPTIALYNLVSCYPREAKQDGTHRPPPDAVRACSPKLREFIGICRPRLIVCVGQLAEKHIHLAADAASETLKFVHVMHPSNILKNLPIAQKDLEVKKSVVRIRKATREVLGDVC
jgi:DNA polymerase